MSSNPQTPEIDALLDTNIISAYLDAKTSLEVLVTIREALERYRHIGIPVVAKAEVVYGIEFSANLHATMDDFNRQMGAHPVIPITDETVESYKTARSILPPEKKRLNDTWIAASGMEHNATVLTGDDDFDSFVEYGLSVHKVPTI